jgi:hypothetical protein
MMDYTQFERPCFKEHLFILVNLQDISVSELSTEHQILSHREQAPFSLQKIVI